MKKLKIEVSLGDLLDRLSILFIKQENLTGDKLEYVKEELEKYLCVMYKLGDEFNDKTKQYLLKLKEINKELWKLEDEVRAYIKDKDFGDEYILITQKIHATNNKRVKLKNEIDKMFGSKIKEVKSYKL